MGFGKVMLQNMDFVLPESLHMDSDRIGDEQTVNRSGLAAVDFLSRLYNLCFIISISSDRTCSLRLSISF